MQRLASIARGCAIGSVNQRDCELTEIRMELVPPFGFAIKGQHAIDRRVILRSRDLQVAFSQDLVVL